MVEQNQKIDKPFRTRAVIIGLLILLAYGAASSFLVQDRTVLLIIEFFSGLTVIGAAVLYIPVLKLHNRMLTYAYVIIKSLEGLLIIVAALTYIPLIMMSGISESQVDTFRALLYDIFILILFGTRFLLLGILLYQSLAVPRFISIWCIIGSSILVVSTIVNIAAHSIIVPFSLSHPLVILNEIFLAFWLIFRGFQTGKPISE